MKIIDLIRLSLQNLWRRKLRTLLTVLGVLIGTASIVSMVSIGIGQQRAFMEMVAGSNELTTITVQSMQGFDPYMSSSGSKTVDEGQLTKKVLEQIQTIPHVTLVSPVLTVQGLAFQGKYQGHVSIKGMTKDALTDQNFQFEQGGFSFTEDEISYVVGPYVKHNFYDPKAMGKMGMGQEYVQPEVDLVSEPFFLVYDTENFYSSEPGTVKPKKYLMQASGSIRQIAGWNPYMDGLLTDIESLEKEMARVFRSKAWPGQPKTKNGRALPDIVYSDFYVRTDAMENTKAVMDQITALGFRPQSNIEWIEQSEAQSRQQQMVLGGIGAISLLVAAIGIANTMMMSIYERTREIGVFKVLGCKLSAIRNLFLLEAAFIGFLGGVIGCGLSYLVSTIINSYAQSGGKGGGMGMIGGPLGISEIPPWLTGAALIFATLIGMISGLMPAIRAMRLSPLEALRTG